MNNIYSAIYDFLSAPIEKLKKKKKKKKKTKKKRK
tara:strand:- start:521 stop:625 length:105 start_codon:yes stop_codon:yes gene_type:complete